MSAATALVYRQSRSDRPAPKIRPAAIVPRLAVVRSAVAADAPAIHRLIVNHAMEGRLLPRSLGEIATHIERFVVACESALVIGCADLAPLSSSTAEVRSLVVDSGARASGIGRRLLAELTMRATAGRFHTLCAFTHSPAYFVHAGFSIVPHTWVPEKIERDCRACSQHRQCGQYAVAMPLGVSRSRLAGVGSFNG
jgi:amino-acid N-acetyltransferase